jgi:hypothetical protein
VETGFPDRCISPCRAEATLATPAWLAHARSPSAVHACTGRAELTVHACTHALAYAFMAYCTFTVHDGVHRVRPRE